MPSNFVDKHEELIVIGILGLAFAGGLAIVCALALANKAYEAFTSLF